MQHSQANEDCQWRQDWIQQQSKDTLKGFEVKTLIFLSIAFQCKVELIMINLLLFRHLNRASKAHKAQALSHSTSASTAAETDGGLPSSKSPRHFWRLTSLIPSLIFHGFVLADSTLWHFSATSGRQKFGHHWTHQMWSQFLKWILFIFMYFIYFYVFYLFYKPISPIPWMAFFSLR